MPASPTAAAALSVLPRVSRSATSDHPLPPSPPARDPGVLRVANATDTPAMASARAPLHARYLQAQRVLDAPLGELLDDMEDADPALSRQNALLAVMRGEDAGDAQARTALVLSVLPWSRVANVFGAAQADPHAAELTLVLMLQALFNTTPEQGRQLLPLVRTYGRELSLAQWVCALAQPRHQQRTLKVDAVPAVEARLKAMSPLAQMEAPEAEQLLLRTLLPGWGPASRAALAQQWRDDRDGWSLADAGVRVRELSDHGRRGIEDALRALHAERDAQRPPTSCAGSVAHAVVGLLQAFFGPSAAAFADGVMARTGMAPGTPLQRHIQPRLALGTVASGVASRDLVGRRLAHMHNLLDEKHGAIAFYRDLMAQDPRTRRAPTPHPAAPLRELTPAPDRSPRGDAEFRTPNALESPGRLTDLGAPVEEHDIGVPGFLPAGAAATLRPLSELEDAFTTLRIQDGTAMPASGGADAVAQHDPTELTEEQVTRIREEVPTWITQASAKDQDILQALLDLEVTTDALLELEIASLESLRAFTGNRLAMALKHVLPSHDVEAADVVVSLVERTYPPADIPGAFFELPQFPQPNGRVNPITTESTMSLVDFALRNSGPNWTLPPELTISVQGRDNAGRGYDLGQQEVVDLVRELNAGERYKAYLKEQLIASTTVREAWTENLRAGMQVAVHTARMSGTVFPPDFYLDPVDGQDFVSRMLDAVITHPAASGRPKVDTHPVEVTTLKIGFASDDSACHVNGLWLVQTTDPQRGITDVAVIAPSVPDGRVVRTYKSLDEARRDPYWRTPEGYAWLKSRMSLADQEKLRVMALRDDPVKSVGKDSMGFFSKDRMHFVPVRENFLQRAYSDYVQTLLKDTDFRSTSTEESTLKAILGFLWDKALLAADLPVPGFPLLPSLRLLGRVGRGFSALGRSKGTGPVAAVVVAGKADDTAKLSPGLKNVLKIGSDESLGPPRVKVDPPAPPPIRVTHERLLGAPPADSLSRLTKRMEELNLKGRLSIPEEAELRLLKEKLPGAWVSLVRQHSHTITDNRQAWEGFINRIPQVPGVSTVAGERYLAYLLSQMDGIGSRLTKMLQILAANGVDAAPPTFRLLHERALGLIGDPPLPLSVQGISKVTGVKTLPEQGNGGTSLSGQAKLKPKSVVLESPFKKPGVLNEDGKRPPQSAMDGSPNKKYAWSSPEGTPQSSPIKGNSWSAPQAPKLGSPLKAHSQGVPPSPGKGSPGKVSWGGPSAVGILPSPVAFPYEVIARENWPKVLYHYTSEKNYAAILAENFVNPSGVDPVGNIPKGRPPRLVYVTELEPSMGRKHLVDPLLGKSQHDRLFKLARAIPLDTENLAEGTQIIRFTDEKLKEVWAISASGDGSIQLRVRDDKKSVWIKPAPGGEIVPMEGPSG